MTTPEILIIEVNPITGEDIKQILIRLGYAVSGIASSENKAIELVKNNRVDLVLMNMNLVNESKGVQLAERLKQECQIPVVYLTSHADKETIDRAKKTEPFGCIVKPFNELDLQATIEIALYKCQSDKTIRDSQEKFQFFVENFQGIAFRGKEDFSIDFITGNIEAITGFTQTDFISGKVIYKQLIHPEDLKRISLEISEFMSGPLKYSQCEYRIVDKNSTIHWVMENISKEESSNGDIFVNGTIQDITERKNSESQIALLKTAVDNSADSICITDTQGIIEYANKAFEALSGYSQKELMGANPRILQSGKHSQDFYEDIWQRLSQKQTWQGKFINKKKDGTLYHEKATISPIFQGDGPITHYIAVKRDITQDLIMEKKLAQSQKMEAIGTLAGGIAHDFNNILSPIIGFSQLSLTSVEKGSTLEENLKEINKAALRAKELVRQILTFSRGSDEGVSPIKMHPIVKETLKFIRSSIPTNIAIETDIDTVSHVMADPTRIHQVVMNLCTNAYQAMENEPGTIKVTLKDIGIDQIDATHIHNLPCSAYVLLTISDTGKGIGSENIDSIFEPYFTTKDVGEGTGLGLSVCQGAVQGMNGEIFVESTLGKGTTFFIYLPISKGPQHQVRAMLDKDSLPKGEESILFVDDEASISKLTKKILESLNYSVIACNSSVQAFRIFKNAPEKFDLVMTDMAMPDMTGDILAAKIKKIRPDIPIILCTGFTRKIFEDEIENFCIDAYCLKPVSIQSLAKKVRRLLDETKKRLSVL